MGDVQKPQGQATLCQQKTARNELRKKMWDLEQEIANNNDEVKDPNSDTLCKLLKKSDALAERIDKPSDQANSVSTFLTLTRAASEKVTRFCRKTTAASPADLIRRLRVTCASALLETLGNDDRVPLNAISWNDLGKKASTFYRSAPSARVECMLGAMVPPKPKKKPAASTKRIILEPVGPSQKPEHMDTNLQDNSNETAKLTEAMYEIVMEHSGKPYAHFILNPQSFAQTVENMFSIAMLVGSAKVALLPDKEWGMCVHLPKTNGPAGPVKIKADPAQMVLNMNYATWKAMSAAVNPEDLLTEHRADIRLACDDDEPAPDLAGSSKKRRVS